MLFKIVAIILAITFSSCRTSSSNSNIKEEINKDYSKNILLNFDDEECSLKVKQLGKFNCKKKYSEIDKSKNSLMRLADLRCKWLRNKKALPNKITEFEINCIIGLTKSEIEAKFGEMDYCEELKAKEESNTLLEEIEGTSNQNSNLFDPGLGIFMCVYNFYNNSCEPNCMNNRPRLNLLLNDSICTNYSWITSQ